MPKPFALVSSLVIVGILGSITWFWLAEQRSQRALDLHLENGTAYATRVLEPIGVLPDELRESSGLAISRTQPGVLWSHNDSGDGPNLYAIGSSGRLLAIVPVANAAAVDWEDMASGPCPPASRRRPARDACIWPTAATTIACGKN